MRFLITVFCVLVIGVIFVGLDNIPGFILGYLATAVIFFMVTRTWRTIKKFLILFIVALLGAIFLSFLYVEVICRLVVMIWGVNALFSTQLHVIELIITYVILFATPICMFIGIAGSLLLYIRKIRLKFARGT